MKSLLELVPLALVIAVNPMPVIALLLMLSSPRGLPRGIAFAGGWMLGVAFTTTAFSYLLSFLQAFLPSTDDRGRLPIVSALPIVVGVALVVAGVIAWLRRSHRAEQPKWMAGLERIGIVRSASIAFAFAALKPKNVALTAAAGVIILDGEPPFSTIVITLVIFTLVASSTLIVPVLLHRFGGPAAARWLGQARTRLTRAMPAITSGALVVLGIAVGIAGVYNW